MARSKPKLPTHRKGCMILFRNNLGRSSAIAAIRLLRPRQRDCKESELCSGYEARVALCHSAIMAYVDKLAKDRDACETQKGSQDTES